MRAKKVLHTILNVILGLVALLVVIHALWNVAASRKLAAAKALVVAAGLPTAPEQVIPPPAADADNAAPLLKRAFLLLQPGWPNSQTNAVTLPTDGDYVAMTDDQKADWRARLAAPPCAEMLDLVAAAAARPRCDFQLKYRDGVALLLPHVSPLRNLSRLTLLRARLAAEAGQPAAALADIHAVLRLARLSEEEPILISQLVRLAMIRSALDALQSMAGTNAPAAWPADEVAAIAAELRRVEADRIASWEKALDGERVLFGALTMEQLITGEMPVSTLCMVEAGSVPGAWKMGGVSYVMRPWLKQSYASYLDHITALRQIGRSPWNEARAREEELTGRIPRWDILTRLMLPAVGNVIKLYDNLLAQCQVTRLGLAAEAYRREHGRYPAALSDVGGNLIDPFSGKPYLYRADEKGLCLYSLGEDGEDNGGALRGPKDTARQRDIVWRVPAGDKR